MVRDNVGLKDATQEEVDAYVNPIREHRDGLLPYQDMFMTVFDELAQLELDLEKSRSANYTQAVDVQQAQHETLIKKLEGGGITTQNNIEADPSYWMRKAVDFKIAHDAVATQTSAWGDGRLGAHPVHAGNSALKINSIMWYPYAGLHTLQVSCFVLDWGWNVDSKGYGQGCTGQWQTEFWY